MEKAVKQLALKVKELETRLDKLSRILFSYHIATVKYLANKGLADDRK